MEIAHSKSCFNRREGRSMPLFKFVLWSVVVACIAWVFKLLLDEEDSFAPETVVSRIRSSGF